MKSWKETLREGFTPPAVAPSMSLGEAVSTTAKAVAEHLLHSPLIPAYLSGVPKGKGTSCLDSAVSELVKYVATQRGDVDKSDPMVNLAFHKEFIMPVFQFERGQMLRATITVSDADEGERRLIMASMALSNLHDRLWVKWFAAVATPYQALDAGGKAAYELLAKDQLAVYDYTAFEFDPKKGCVNRRTWAEAFPEEIGVLSGLLTHLELDEHLDASLNRYFGVLANAYSCRDISSLEECWAEVDRAWVKIPTSCRIIPVHGMESGYEHPFGVSPEFRLEVRTDESRDIIERSRVATIKHAESLGVSLTLVEVAKQKLERIDIGVFVNVFRAGVSLNFRYAGQAVPNRQDIVTDVGGRIFIDQAAQHLALATYVEYLDKHCTPETAEALKPFITARNQCIHTVVHEYAHPVGRTKESDEALGREGMALLEEAKASLLGVLGDEWREPTPENRLQLIAVTVARLIRFMRKNMLSNTTAAPYVRENFVAATTLFDSGVLQFTERGIEVNIERAERGDWFGELELFNQVLLRAYQERDTAMLQSLTTSYCDREANPIADLIKWVNRE